MEAVEDIPWRTSVGVKFTYRVLIPSRSPVSRQFTDLSSIIASLLIESVIHGILLGKFLFGKVKAK
jgi:hypothetical protein